MISRFNQSRQGVRGEEILIFFLAWQGQGQGQGLTLDCTKVREESDGVTLTEEFDEPGSSEEAEEAQVDEVILGEMEKEEVTIHPPPGAQSHTTHRGPYMKPTNRKKQARPQIGRGRKALLMQWC